MFLSVIIYGILFLVMVLLSNQAYRKKNNTYILFSSLVYALVFGLRYGVGRDYPSYLINYLWYLRGSVPINSDEFGFELLQKAFAGLEMHPVFFFGFISFVQICLFYYIFRDKKYLLVPFTAIYMLSAAWLPFSSALRQALAMSFFVIALRYTDVKGLFKYFALIFLCYSMHRSAVILAIFYPLFLYKSEWFKRPKIELIVYFISVVFMVTHVFESLLRTLDAQIFAVATFLSYDNYLDMQYSDRMYIREEGVGMGQLVYICLYSVFIINSKKIKAFFNDDYLLKSYDLFFIGAVVKSLVNGSNLFGRLTWYFEYFYLIFGAYALYYFYKRDKQSFYISLSLVVLIFVAILYKGDINYANYYFYWDKAQFEADHVGKVIRVN